MSYQRCSGLRRLCTSKRQSHQQQESNACRMGKASRFLYVSAALVHFCAWVIAAAGLSASQYSCDDLDHSPASDALFSPVLGDNCSKLFRCAPFAPAPSADARLSCCMQVTGVGDRCR